MTETPLQYIRTDEKNNRLYFKRDDLLPFSFGGNKVRIARCYLADMRSKGANHMICYGNTRSNLCRAISNLCCAEGIPCTIISPADDDGSRQMTANEALCRLCGAKPVPCTKQNVAQTVSQVLRHIESSGETPYYIYGNELGTGLRSVPVRAYQPIYREIMAQCRAQQFLPTHLVLAVGTGTTVAGLLCGLAEASESEPPTVIGISIARDRASVLAHVQDYVCAWAEENRKPASFVEKAMAHVVIRDEYRLVYGQCDSETDAFLRSFYRSHGIALDGTYTGKALHAYLSLSEKEKAGDVNTVFLHTGGTPLFFDSLYQSLR